MKSKISKVFVVIFGAFLLLGGLVFSACGKKEVHATISVSSQSFDENGVINLDIGSGEAKAEISAKVEGTSGGSISVNNENQTIVFTESTYDSKTNVTTIKITAKSEGDATLMLRAHGNAEREIKVFVYSDITAMEQNPDATKQYVVRGEQTPLDPSRYLKFTSRKDGESNRKDVTWSLQTQSEFVTLDEANRLTVSEDYDQSQIVLVASSVYTNLSATVTLDVVKALPKEIVPGYFVGDEQTEGQAYIPTSEEVENAISLEVNNNKSLYLEINVGSEFFPLVELPKAIVKIDGKEDSSIFEITRRSYSDKPIDVQDSFFFKLKPKSSKKVGLVEVCFEIKYSSYNLYSVQTKSFYINLEQIVNQISVSSNGEDLVDGEKINIYDHYTTVGQANGRPIYVELGPDTIQNDKATFKIKVSPQVSMALEKLSDALSIVCISDGGQAKEIEFDREGSSFVTKRSLTNKTTIFVKVNQEAAETYDGSEFKIEFIADQNKNVNSGLTLVCGRSPGTDFVVESENFKPETRGENQVYAYYLPINISNSQTFTFTTSEELNGIKGFYIKPISSNQNLFSVSGFSFNQNDFNFTISTTLTQQELATAQNTTFEFQICHENGFVGVIDQTNSFIVQPFISMEDASVKVDNLLSSGVISEENNQNNEGMADPQQSGTGTLSNLIMQTGSTVVLNFFSNAGIVDLANNGVIFVSGEGLDENPTAGMLIAAYQGQQGQPDNVEFSIDGHLSINSDFNGYCLVTFSGYDRSHENTVIYRIFHVEAYTAPTRLTADEQGVTLPALDSISTSEANLARATINVSYRPDNKPVTYASGDATQPQGQVTIYSQNYYNDVNGVQPQPGKDNFSGYKYIKCENIIVTNKSISFDIVALTTDGYDVWSDQIVVTYEVHNRKYYTTIDVLIENSQRVENIRWINETADGEIYLDLNGIENSDRSAMIITSVSPLYARNTSLCYKFVPDSTSNKGLLDSQALENGIVTIAPSLTEGGTGYVYIFPQDAIKLSSGFEQIVYYVDNRYGQPEERSFSIDNIGENFEQALNGYFYRRVSSDEITRVYFSNILKRIKVVVADGATEERATRIYDENELKNISISNHYVLMNSLTLNNWQSIGLGQELTGSLKGYSSDISINFAGESNPLFDTIGESGKVENLSVSGSVNGGGFVANQNKGLVHLITAAVNITSGQNTQSVTKSIVTGTEYAGAIVGINNGLISSVNVEGVEISATDYAGAVAGLNNGRIGIYNSENGGFGAKVEFYIFKDGENTATNTITAAHVGGIVGKISSNGVIESSYAYNYSSFDVLISEDKGSFAAQAEGEPTIKQSFAWNLTPQNDLPAVASGDENVIYEDVYFNADANSDEITNRSNWIYPGEIGYNGYVRKSGEQNLPYLANLYQAQTVSSLDAIAVQQNVKDGDHQKVYVNGATNILFLHAVEQVNLTGAETSALNALNTISLSDLFESDGNNLIALSSRPDIAEVRGSALIVKHTGEFKLTISAKQDYSKYREIDFVVLNALDLFGVVFEGDVTTGFQIQANRSSEVEFTIENTIYLANNPIAFVLQQTKFEVQTSVEQTEGTDKLTFQPNGMQATLFAQIESQDGKAKTFNASVNIKLSSYPEGDVYDAIKKYSQKDLVISASKGANEIGVSNEELTIEPSFNSQLYVWLDTDYENDDIELSFAERELSVERVVSSSNSVTWNVKRNNATIMEIVQLTKGNESEIHPRTYVLTIKISESYRSQISADQSFHLQISSKSKTAINENRQVVINLSRQNINYIDMINYKPGANVLDNNTFYYTRMDTLTSGISPGRTSIMNVFVDPDYAYYKYMTLTYSRSGQTQTNFALGITSLEFEGGKTSSTRYTQSATTSTAPVPNGIRVERKQNGAYAFLIYAGANINQNSTFVLTAAFYDENGVEVKHNSFNLFVAALPIAELQVNGSDEEVVVAKGSSARLSIMLDNDQQIESLVASSIGGSGVKGIELTPENGWEIVENYQGTGKKMIYLTVKVNIDAGIQVEEEGKIKYVNGMFQIEATVARIYNGVREIRRSYAYIVIADFMPAPAVLERAEYSDSLDAYVFEAYNNINLSLDFEYNFDPQDYAYDQTNDEDREVVDNLMTARNDFAKNLFYYSADSEFSINYRDGQPIPLTQRIYDANNNQLQFNLSSDGKTYVYEGFNFKLNYVIGEDNVPQFSVIGLRTTASPVVLIMRDLINIAQDGRDVNRYVDTRFAIRITDFSSGDRPHMITSAEEFLSVDSEGEAHDYILMNDITLVNYTPISASKFRSLDGNGQTIHIESFNTSGSGNLDLALFTTIPQATVIKNLRVNLYNGGNIVVNTAPTTGYRNIRIAAIALDNYGIITNTQVVAYQNPEALRVNTGELGLQVTLLRGSSQYYIADESVTSEIAGFVLNNHSEGSITNSTVGGQEIVVIGEQQGSTDKFYYSTEKLGQFTLYGQGNMAGFVLNNDGQIASSGAEQIQITNDTHLNSSETAGFVGRNTGKVRMSMVAGVQEQTDTGNEKYYLSGSNIKSQGKIAGFVINNGEQGEISNCYSNISLVDLSNNPIKGRTAAGFVYENKNLISTSYSASFVEKSDLLNLNFSGVDENGNSLNTGKIELSYYYNPSTDTNVDDLEKVITNLATPIMQDEVKNKSAYYGFIFQTSSTKQDGIWRMVDPSQDGSAIALGLRLVSRDIVTLSHRYYVGRSDNTYDLPFAQLTSVSAVGRGYDTTYGSSDNPILITSAKDFKEAVGESSSSNVRKYYTNTEVKGSYRFVSDIDMSALNDEFGNATISSINKAFTGTLEGNGFQIKKLSLGSQEGVGSVPNTAGLFGQIKAPSSISQQDQALVQNLDIEINNVTFGRSNIVGSLAGMVSDAIISNINVTQNSALESISSRKGVQGGNLTGGIIGAVFGETKLNGLSAKDIVVQSSYSSSSEDNDKYVSFDPQPVRESQVNQIGFYDAGPGGVGSLSVAGGIVGYYDGYLSIERTSSSFNYQQGLQAEAFDTQRLNVNGVIDIRGEVVGGVIGFTGVKTKVKDASLQIENGSKILSYNGFAGGIVGFANGQFEQIYSEYDEELQANIEGTGTLTNNIYSYYQGNLSAERGALDIFVLEAEDEAGQVAGETAVRYKPKYIGGLFGGIKSAAVAVSYSKINVINAYEGGFAGGIAGGVFPNKTTFIVQADENSAREQFTTYLHEVYTSSDVFVVAGGDNNEDSLADDDLRYGGLFGKIAATSGDLTNKIALSSVNAVNHYGINNNRYGVNDKIYAIAGSGVQIEAQDMTRTTYNEHGEELKEVVRLVEPTNVGIIVSAVANQDNASASADNKSGKSFGFMETYVSSNGTTLTVVPFKGIDVKGVVYGSDNSWYDYNIDEKGDAVTTDQNKANSYMEAYQKIYDDLYFTIKAISEFNNVQTAYSETNGAFINSRAWNARNWKHLTNTLYPQINFAHSESYMYLDVYNKAEVLAEMQENPNLEIRVRGLKEPTDNAGQMIFKNIVLTDQDLAAFQSFKGTILGAIDWSWGSNQILTTIEGKDITAYPGLEISDSMFLGGGANEGLVIRNLNIFMKPKDDNDTINYSLFTGTAQKVSLENVDFYIYNQVIPSGDGNNAGIIAPNADSGETGTSTKFVDISLNFFANITESKPAVILKANNAGLLVGTFTQRSKYSSLRVQNIVVRYDDTGSGNSPFLEVQPSSGEVNVGLYVGKIENGKENDNVASSSLEIAPPQRLSTILNSAGGENNPLNTKIVISNNDNVSTLNFGGYFGMVTSSRTSLSLYIQNDVANPAASKIILDTRTQITDSANVGGFVGNASLQSFSSAYSNPSAANSVDFACVDLMFGKNVANLNAGLLFGKLEGAIAIGGSETANVQGSITTSNEAKFTVKTLNDATQIGGLVGNNSASLVLQNIVANLKVYSGATLPTLNKNIFGINNDTNNDIASKLVNADALNFGGFVGNNSNSILISGANNEFNNNDDQDSEGKDKEAENFVCFQTTTSAKVGDIVGQTSGSVTVNGTGKFSSNSINVFNYNNPSTSSTSTDVSSFGGLIGLASGNVTVGSSQDRRTIQVGTNNIISGFTSVNAGGVIGEVGSSNTPISISISGTTFSGAFKFEAFNKGTHNVGGLIGDANSAPANLNIELNANNVYGDAIYSLNSNSGASAAAATEDKPLSTYYFGGLVGVLPNSLLPISSQSTKLIANNNYIAFTNNNPFTSSGSTIDYNADAMFGNATDAKFGSPSVVTLSGNLYSSQLVLATSLNADDIGAYKNVSGQAFNANKSPDQANNIATKIGTSGLPVGHKLNPITTGSSTSAKNLNGIMYYTSQVPTELTKNAAFVGDFSSFTLNRRFITSVGEHSFVAGAIVTVSENDSAPATNDKNVGGIVNELTNGTIFACRVNGELSVGGTDRKNVGGIAGQMENSRISNCFSNVDLTYRAGESGNVAAVATTASGTANKGSYNLIEKTYSTGMVRSYITANLYAFTNGDGTTAVRNSYTISWLDGKNYTFDGSRIDTRGIFGRATLNDCYYDSQATEFVQSGLSDWSALASASSSNLNNDNVWTTKEKSNYGYPYLNFGAFKKSSYVTVGADGTITEAEETAAGAYYAIPNYRRLSEMETLGEGKYLLLHDIDLSLHAPSSWSTMDLSDKTFNGGNHTISGLGTTLFSKIQDIENLKVIAASGANGGSIDLDISSGTERRGGLVAQLVTGDAKNVSARGYIEYNITAENNLHLGGLFGEAQGDIKDCTNFVKIDASGSSTVYIDVGGVVGWWHNDNGNSIEVLNCYNYAPIDNNCLSTGEEVKTGGVVGSGEDGPITNCGNENAVFCGYSGGTGNHRIYAGGVVGYTTNSISNCYNTAMVKAGNKEMNDNSSSSDKVAYAGGIAGHASSASGCTNIGYIEALGANPNVTSENISTEYLNCGFKDDDNPDKYDKVYIKVTKNSFSINVYADEIVPNLTATSSTTGGSTFKNGTYKSTFFNTNDVTYLNFNSGNTRSVSFGDNYSITINTDASKNNGLVVAEVDQMGMPTKVYVKATRELDYPGTNNTITQKIYSQITTIAEYYKDAKSTSTNTNVNISRTANASSGNSNWQVNIAGFDYAFVNSGEQFLSAATSGYYVYKQTIDKIDGRDVSALRNANYNFTLTLADGVDGYANMSVQNDGIHVTVYSKAAEAPQVTIHATKSNYVQEVHVDQSNIEKEGGQIKITFKKSDLSSISGELDETKSYTIGTYNFGLKIEDDNYVFTSTGIMNADEAIASLTNGTQTLSLISSVQSQTASLSVKAVGTNSVTAALSADESSRFKLGAGITATLREMVLILGRENGTTITDGGEVEIDGQTYYVSVSGDNVTLFSDASKQDDYKIAEFNLASSEQEDLVKNISQYVQATLSRDEDGAIQLAYNYLGSNGNIEFEGKAYTYTFIDSGDSTLITIFNAEGEEVYSGSTDGVEVAEFGEYSISTTMSDIAPANDASFTDGALTATFDDASFNEFNYVEFNYSLFDNITMSLPQISNGQDVEETIPDHSFISSVTVSENNIEVYNSATLANDNIILSDDKDTITFKNTKDSSHTYNLQVTYVSPNVTVNNGWSTEGTSGGATASTAVSTIILTADIALGSDQTIGKDNLKILGNHHAITFINNNNNGLFTESPTSLYDIDIAGTVIGINTAGILGTSISGETHNVSTFGTKALTGATHFTDDVGLVAGEIKSTSGSINNFASYSVCGEGFDGVKTLNGISPNMEEALVGATNYGMIIGSNGGMGASAEAAGKDGQSVAIISQNVNSANTYTFANYGVIKAGNGGNGARGTDGRGGDDKEDGTAPGSGTNGTDGGAAGSAGSIIKSYTKKEVNTTTTETITGGISLPERGGTAGTHGNNGWGGLNLMKYSSASYSDKYGIGSVSGNKRIKCFDKKIYSNFGEEINFSLTICLGRDYDGSDKKEIINKSDNNYEMRYERGYHDATMQDKYDVNGSATWTKYENLIYYTKGIIYFEAWTTYVISKVDVQLYYFGAFKNAGYDGVEAATETP